MKESVKILLSIGILCSFILIIYWTYSTLPPIPQEHRSKLKFPSDVKDVKALSIVLSKYKDDYFFQVVFIFSLLFIFFQTFSVPGTIFFSFLAGSLFGLIPGLIFVCFLSATGASGAYFMSSLIGKRIVQYFAANRLKQFGEQIEQQRKNLWSYFVFVRISPLLPNWFVNLASPIIFIPFHIFFVGTFIGVIPQSFIAVKAGLTLQDIKSMNDILNFKSFLSLFFLAFLALIPTLKPVQALMEKILTKKSEEKVKEE